MNVNVKETAREEAKIMRQILHGKANAAVYDDLSAHLTKLIKAISQKESVIAGFWSIGSEVDTRMALSDISRLGFVLALPAIAKAHTPLEFRQFEMGDELFEGLLSTKEPSAKAPTLEPDILIVPLLAFDHGGHRLGYGGGYYDRTIEALTKHKKITTIGLAFAGQKVKQVPHDTHDIKLDYIITEQGLLGGLEML